MDPIIYRDPLRTPQFDSTYLNNPSFVGSFDDEDFVYFFFREGKILQNFSPMGKAPLSPLLKYFSEESPKMESRLKCWYNCSWICQNFRTIKLGSTFNFEPFVFGPGSELWEWANCHHVQKLIEDNSRCCGIHELWQVCVLSRGQGLQKWPRGHEESQRKVDLLPQGSPQLLRAGQLSLLLRRDSRRFKTHTGKRMS